MADVAMADRTAQKPAEPADSATPRRNSIAPEPQATEAQPATSRGQTSSEKDTASISGTHTEGDLPSRPQPPASPAGSHTTSKLSDTGRPANIPKRPEIERGPPGVPNMRSQVSALPRHQHHREDRLPPRPTDPLEDRRDRLAEYPRGGRFGGDHDFNRSFDQSLGDGRNSYGRLDREYPSRPHMDEPFRGLPHRDGRPPRDSDWPGRSGRLRLDARDGPPGARTGPPTHPDRAGMIEDHPERPVETYRRGDSGRQERDDRRGLPPRALSPVRAEPLGRPERFADDRRPANFSQAHPRNEDMPTGPRERFARPPPDGPDARDPAPGIDMNHGRLRQPEPIAEVPLGPRGRTLPGRGGRIVSGLPPPGPASPASGPMAATGSQPPTGPGRQGLRNGPDSPGAGPSSPSGEKLDTSGMHPDRLKVLQGDNTYNASPRTHPPTSPASIVPPTGPRSGVGPPAGPSSMPRGPPSGPGNFGGERGRGDKRFAGINNMLQQSGGPLDRGPGPTIRGRGANRQSAAMNAPSPQATRPQTPVGLDEGARTGPPSQGRPDLLANRPSVASYGEEDGPPRNRLGGGRELLEDTSTENRRAQRFSSGATFPPDRERERERERRGGDDDGSRSSGRREDLRDRARDYERERSRRSDVGASASREERYESREVSRRGPGAREDNRRRRDRDDGSDLAVSQENEGRLRPPSSLGGTAPTGPPAPVLPGSEDERRWGGGRDMRDRDRTRDRPRDRDYHRDGGGGGPHRKRNRPGDEQGPVDGGGRGGMRMGSENKRPRRGA
ncbi:hypothetical protein BO71DRAFT_315120 [Aspergillus ellipticus CBS 707.79]|uniref:Uncharacterized protein n=1 Tax=Aspergillus ellipticus CBS 707.79 TaxID=1448320 RepID=A0A319E5Z6_9EURO|nr:hypothetical protein BO71DRAFT_315120 [Aspergillus ellipticus CBS 707.79]